MPDYRSSGLPDGYLAGGYYSDARKEKLKKEYIIDLPKKIAKELEYDGGRDANKRTQIRKFYEYLLRVELKMQLKENDYSMVEADLAALVPYVSYAGKRRLVSRIFQQFIEKNVNAVHDANDLRAFAKHFEALVAFTKKE